MKVITREQARRAGRNRYYTGRRCKRGHLSERFTSTAACVACTHEADAKRRAEQPTKRALTLLPLGRDWKVTTRGSG